MVQSVRTVPLLQPMELTQGAAGTEAGSAAAGIMTATETVTGITAAAGHAPGLLFAAAGQSAVHSFYDTAALLIFVSA